MRAFLDKLPAVFAAKKEPKKRRDTPAQTATVNKLVEATLSYRRVNMTYHSFASKRVKDYIVEPYRLAYSQGGLYLFAFVPAYKQMRTFAVERIRKLSVLEEHFSPLQGPTGEPFEDSFGIHTGKPEAVEILFASSAAPYIKEREWHRTQKIRELPDGSLVLSLKVCADWALESWILSFGPLARVLKPAQLAERVLDKIHEAHDQYAPHLDFEVPEPPYDASVQRSLLIADSAR
jgi:proteasome accessory factor B